MLTHIGCVYNPALRERVRRWLTNTYGSSVTRCVETLQELQSLCALQDNTPVILTDLPPGTLLRQRYDDLLACANQPLAIIIINPGTSDVFVPAGNRSFSIVPEGRLERALEKVLRLR